MIYLIEFIVYFILFPTTYFVFKLSLLTIPFFKQTSLTIILLYPLFLLLLLFFHLLLLLFLLLFYYTLYYSYYFILLLLFFITLIIFFYSSYFYKFEISLQHLQNPQTHPPPYKLTHTQKTYLFQ